MQFINYLKVRIFDVFNKEGGQTGLEYLLVVGGVSVAVIAAIVAVGGLAGLVDPIIKGVCTQAKTIVSSITCP